MNPDEFSPENRLRLVEIGKDQWAYHPPPLPPILDYDLELSNVMTEAGIALGNLNVFGSEFSNPALFVDFLVKREAVLSSQIEGSRATIYDVYARQAVLFEELENHSRDPEMREVFNYINALYYGRSQLMTFRYVFD